MMVQEVWRAAIGSMKAKRCSRYEHNSHSAINVEVYPKIAGEAHIRTLDLCPSLRRLFAFELEVNGATDCPEDFFCCWIDGVELLAVSFDPFSVDEEASLNGHTADVD